ncbi:NUDIX hydrolase domain-like protein [Xylariaceae sp. AK1471]|nr:NUDIX hydrolase domain-like protein [Xylariaceae sp. AK1471]
MSNPIGNKSPDAKVIGTKQPDRSYIDRYAVRVVTVNASGDIALIYVKKGSYYKLPGGGIERDEDHGKAAAREVQEETGAVVSMRNSDCIATTEEFRNDLHQISYVYIADVVDASGKPELTEEELVDGLTHEWIPVQKALEKMGEVQPTSELGRFIKQRDIYLLREAAKVLQA